MWKRFDYGRRRETFYNRCSRYLSSLSSLLIYTLIYESILVVGELYIYPSRQSYGGDFYYILSLLLEFNYCRSA